MNEDEVFRSLSAAGFPRRRGLAMPEGTYTRPTHAELYGAVAFELQFLDEGELAKLFLLLKENDRKKWITAAPIPGLE